jgi:hypothetical protein
MELKVEGSGTHGDGATSGNEGEADIYACIWDTLEQPEQGDVEPPPMLYMCSINVHVNVSLDQNLHNCTHHDIGIYFVKLI